MADQTPTDEQLLRRMAAGDEDALVALYRRRQGAVYRFAVQMTGSAAVAEDVTQEVFLELLRNPKRFDPSRGSVAAFLYGMARNFVLRRLQGEREQGCEPEVLEQVAATCDPLGDLTRIERIGALREAVLALPRHYREAVVLCDLHEMSYEQAAGVLGCAVGTVRSRLHRARAMLAERLRADGPRPAGCCPCLVKSTG